MERRKTLVVVQFQFWSLKRGWSIRLAGNDPASRDDLIKAIRDVVERHKLILLNAADPFGVGGTKGAYRRTKKEGGIESAKSQAEKP